MVEVVRTGFLNEIRERRSSRDFPPEDIEAIADAVTAVGPSVFRTATSGQELKRVDARIAKALPDYEHEHDGPGRNPACKLWADDGFDHSVDLYHPDKRIAIEVEKSERKRVSDDVLKFIRGGKTRRARRDKIEFGCLVVPTNYRGSGNLFASSMRTLEFVRSVLFVEDIAVLGYRDPRWD